MCDPERIITLIFNWGEIHVFHTLYMNEKAGWRENNGGRTHQAYR